MRSRFLWCLLLLLLALPHAGFGSEYVIGEGDTLDVAVWGVKDLSFTVKVRPDGKITVPGLGEVSASGVTPNALQSTLAVKLKELVKNPMVTVTVKEITNSKVYVFGSGVKSTVYDLSRRTSLLQLLCVISEVKGADLKKAYLLREGKKLNVDFHKLFIGGEIDQDLQLQTNDALFLPLLLDRSVYVMGAVNTPKAIEYREGMKVMEAILEAGGFTKFADEDDVVVRRKTAGEPISLPVKAKRLFKKGDLSQNIELKAGDYIMVKESFF
ncbi:polysaccharide biosynthesis/export family protein [Geomesophilobacter sediminis]|uniref:Polysaccharide biosynthesis/export family protein n=1 Tax=Geomesophilobacter sediminis TaxID=2798584 RepID=A0A8J7JB08_9BACT|nr:polysaccharide biosynthesis/export family protein [Geomesophilobacter sediminis]MBJ6723668.1 polysaccharide biosynthesis/export family protein [Geomesophilobacter sediminis]